MRRFVASDVEMFRRQRPVMRGHLLVMLPGDRIGRAFGAAFEHFRLFLQDLSLGHDSAPIRSGQTGEIDDRDTEDGPDGPEGGIPALRPGTVIFDGRHDTASRCSGRDYIPRLFQDDYVMG